MIRAFDPIIWEGEADSLEFENSLIFEAGTIAQRKKNVYVDTHTHIYTYRAGMYLIKRICLAVTKP